VLLYHPLSYSSPPNIIFGIPVSVCLPADTRYHRDGLERDGLVIPI
jgi:hypothetical protein